MDLQSAWRLVSAVSRTARRLQDAIDADDKDSMIQHHRGNHRDAEKAALEALTGIPADDMAYVSQTFGYAASTPTEDETTHDEMVRVFRLPDADEANAVPSVVTRTPIAFDLHMLDEYAA